jgi:hypothetical protein
MTTTWYRLSTYGEIEPVEVVSETPKFVVVESSLTSGKTRHDRVAKDTDWNIYRSTKRECFAWMMARRESELKAAKAKMAEATDKIAKVLADARKEGVAL